MIESLNGNKNCRFNLVTEQQDATIHIVSQLVTMICKAVLFDMDGTRVDSAQVVKLAW